MVNVPGRSKACNTCIGRKKKCDMQKPSCARCLRDRLQCEGYDRPTIFVQGGFPRTTVTWPSAPKKKSKPYPVIPLMLPAPKVAPLSISRATFIEGLASVFWKDILPSEHRLTEGWPTRPGNFLWIGDLISSHSPLLQQTLQCLYLAYSANKAGDQGMSRKAFQIYGSTLANINGILHDPAKAARNDSLVPAISFLAVFEKFNGFARFGSHLRAHHNWGAHVQGLARLLLLRGPNNHQEGISHLGFVRSRWALFAGYFSARKSCPFASHDWRTIPWTNHVKSRYDMLLDALFRIPGILEQLDHAESTEDHYKSLDALISVRESMRAWKRSLREHLLHLYPRSFLEPCIMAADPNEYLKFGPEISHTVVTYWGVSLEVTSQIIALRSKLALLQTKSTETPLDRLIWDEIYNRVSDLELKADVDFYVRAIIASVPYFVHPDSGILGLQNITFPAAALMRHIMSSRDFDITMVMKMMAVLTPPSPDTLHGQLLREYVSQLMKKGGQNNGELTI